MKKYLLLLLFWHPINLTAQASLELTPSGFAPATISFPTQPVEKSIDAAKSWAYAYNKKGADIYDVTDRSLKIDALKENAFFFRNVGEKYVFKIKYSLELEFVNSSCRVVFKVKEIYGKDQKVVNATISDYFTSDGKLKEDYEEVKPSLEYTVNSIIESLSSYLAP